MEIKLRGRNLIITHMLKSNEGYRVSESKKFKSVTILRDPQIVVGVASSTESNHDVLLIDYDTPELEVITNDYLLIQKKFSLPQAYLFRTKKGYHLICLKKFLPRMIYTILSHTRCDSAFTSMVLRNAHRNWILRISPKKNAKRPEFVGLIGEEKKHYTGTISKAHKDFLTKIYPKIQHPPYKALDKSTKINLQKYEAT